MIAFEVILGVLTGGAVNALKATGVGAKIMAASSKIHNKIGHFGDGLTNVSKRMLNDVGDVVLPESVLGLDGKKYPVKRNDLMDHDRPQNMKMDGDKDGGGGNPFNKAKGGGKHHGFYNNALSLTDTQLTKGVKKLQRQIDEHTNLINDPQGTMERLRKGDFSSLDPRQQKALVNKKWPSDIKRQQEQQNILKGILDER